MRVELAKLHKELKTTVIYVTHDQTEAMTLGTKIIVMKDGVVQQADTPEQIYRHPANKFVAGFIGAPSMNFMETMVTERNGAVYLEEIFKLFACRESYPIYIHCWAGADRTGTILALLKSALGVSYHDITRDFEISTFAKFGVRGRCNKDFTYVEMFEHLKNNEPGETLKEQARAFLTGKVGLSGEDLSNIEQILLERPVL